MGGLVDYFLKIDGIEGESADAKHKGEIDVLSWSWGASQSGTMQFGGGGGAGKVQMQDFGFTMRINKATPKLFLHCANGAHIKQAVLTARKAGKEQQEYLKLTFTDILVSSYQTGGSGDSDVVPIESISLNFAKIEFEYKEQKADGTLSGPIKTHYDLKTNKGG
ncbi:MAG TPA: type VI secretion system tube protein Hcp [Thermoanaerobaculia bacterium]|nr:type VI secretion system tube protein Hcp [Thermoanaerobaculia bacterium]